MGEDSSLLGSKNSHSIKHSSKGAESGLALLQRNTLLEKETHQLKKELLEHKLMFQEYRMKTDLQLEESRVREERILKSNEETQKLMKQLMEMMKQKQA